MRQLLIPPRFDDTRVLDFVQEVDNDIVLLDADAVEMSSHSLDEVLLALAPELGSSRHRGGLQADVGLRHDPVPVR